MLLNLNATTLYCENECLQEDLASPCTAVQQAPSVGSRSMQSHGLVLLAYTATLNLAVISCISSFCRLCEKMSSVVWALTSHGNQALACA
jgi:hypothetical protein